GGGSYVLPRGWSAAPRARYVRTCLSHRLWSAGGGLCRRVYAEHPLGSRRATLSGPRTLEASACALVHRCQPRRAWGGASALPDAPSRRLWSHGLGLAGCAALCAWQPLWALVSGVPVLRALVGLRQMLGGKTRWHTGTM